jgi:hypothetical protein
MREMLDGPRTREVAKGRDIHPWYSVTLDEEEAWHASRKDIDAYVDGWFARNMGSGGLT